MRKCALLVIGLALLVPARAQAQTTPTEGLRVNDPGVHALTGARIVVGPGQVLEGATLVIRNGIIEAVGTNVTPPPDARVWDLTGRTIYPGFIDAYSDVGMPTEGPAEDAPVRGALHWNPQVRAWVHAAELLGVDDDRAERLRAQGFTTAMAVPQLGMIRGQTAAVSLNGRGADSAVLGGGIAQSVVLDRDNRVGGGYPTSGMGAVAFLRQVLLDADWYIRAREAYEAAPAGLERPEFNLGLAALEPSLRGELPIVFETSDAEELLRALRIADEFGVVPWVVGSGSEYRLLDTIAAHDVPLILPVAFPDAPDVADPGDALDVELDELRHWYLAPENPSRLASAGVEFALTTFDLDDDDDFLANVREAVRRGLPADTALAALTTTPARLLGLDRTHGTLEAGKIASLVVADGELFTGDAEVSDVWIDGRHFEVTAPEALDLRGTWSVEIAGATTLDAGMTLEGSPTRVSGQVTADSQSAPLTNTRVQQGGRRLEVAFESAALGLESETAGLVRVWATASANADELNGWGELPDGRRLSFHAERTAGPTSGATGSGNGSPTGTSNGTAAATQTAPPLQLADIRPAIAYGRESMPEQPQAVLVRNATVWTQGPQGIIEGGDLLVEAGRVSQVGQNLTAPAGAVVIDATGKHVTPGIIDAHLHAGASGGINETGSAIVPEVQLGDMLTMDNPWTYLQLAGGTTTAHVMHGSANPIGGQNQIVKMRWGALPEDIKFEGAPRTVKFALGENPKRREGRYPDTRMGTHQIIRDHFQAALEYARDRDTWESGGRAGIPLRRDLRMDALVDILTGNILVQSHSYRQDEILMLMRLAEEYGFRIKAFQHAVEAYKVAPELAAHGAGAAVWSDWSSFKIEAYDGTTYNARLLLEAGVVTSLHSDNSQLSTRMHWEAAKMLRTGLDEETALSLVTSGTAAVLGIADRVGSLEAGKDGDFVIWSASPLSTFTRAEQTWIDGRKYFDMEEDLRMREQVKRERAQLIQLILSEQANGAGR
jgi:imidazolonepropionase-like amidohydrolase